MKKMWLLFFLCSSLWGADFRAGAARIDITPELPIWMAGYAARTHPAEKILTDLWAKALALEDAKGNRAVIVTMDLIGLPANIANDVAKRIQDKYGIKRAGLLLNTSHTHSGPVVYPNLKVMCDFDPQNNEAAIRYSRKLTEKLISVIGSALARLTPANLAWAKGTASFAINRRESTPKGMRIGLNPAGPVDNGVPVWKVASSDGRIIAVLFGYACHNTTLGGNSYSINGDYAGFAQLALEKTHPDALAMFMELCGADQNPAPRGTVELAEKYGQQLASAVEQVLVGKMESLSPLLRTAYLEVKLEFEPQSRSFFEQELKSPDTYRQRRAKLMLEAMDNHKPIQRILYPVQALGFSSNLALLALGGEVVVDYSLRVKREYPVQDIVVAGYSNEVMCYIPSQRVLREGGYEVVDSMIYYGQPGPFRDDVEERTFQGIHEVLAKVLHRR
jgi:hypothetical protein